MKEENIDFNALTEAGDEEQSGTIRTMKVYDGRNYYITLRLSDLGGATIIENDDEETGEIVRGLFLPFKDAGLTVTSKKNVLAVFKAELAQIPQNGYTHLLTQIVDYDILQNRSRLGFRHGFCGKMRPAEFKKKKHTR